MDADVMCEAMEFHGLEQMSNLEKYGEMAERVHNEKAEVFEEIQRKHANGESISEKDLLFLQREAEFLYNPNVTKSIPYLAEHKKRMYTEIEREKSIEAFSGIYGKIALFTHEIEKTKIGFFSGKKELTEIKTKGKSLKKEVMLAIEELDDYHNWVFRDGKKEELIENKENVSWLIDTARKSIEEQAESIDFFFLHHSKKVRFYSRAEENNDNFLEVLYAYKSFLNDISLMYLGNWDKKRTLEETKNKVWRVQRKTIKSYRKVMHLLQK